MSINFIPIEINTGSVPNFEKVSELKNWILSNLDLLGIMQIKSNGRCVQFSKSSINRSLKDAGRKEARRNSYMKLREIVENSVYGYSKKVDSRHLDRVIGQEMYYNIFIYDGGIYGVEISIDIPKSKNNFHAYAGHKIKIMKTTPGISEVSSKEGLLDSTGVATINITDCLQLFNPNYKNIKENMACQI